MQARPVVTVFVRHEGRLLLLRRSNRVGSYRGLWGTIAGHIEKCTAREQALREIREETGLSEGDVTLFAEGPSWTLEDGDLGIAWVIHPFLFETMAPQKVRLDWEHTAIEWVRPEGLSEKPCVPGLSESLSRVLAQ
ncbi:MAG: NUDIX domain-containing protein [Euryarchaeota archaeon]|nr:NUDIX domain-containing protein [Euryarchaeota archaeon]